MMDLVSVSPGLKAPQVSIGFETPHKGERALFKSFSNSDLIVWGLLLVIALIVAAAAYLDFGTLKSFRINVGSRISREDFIERTRSKTV